MASYLYSSSPPTPSPPCKNTTPPILPPPPPPPPPACNHTTQPPPPACACNNKTTPSLPPPTYLPSPSPPPSPRHSAPVHSATPPSPPSPPPPPPSLNNPPPALQPPSSPPPPPPSPPSSYFPTPQPTPSPPLSGYPPPPPPPSQSPSRRSKKKPSPPALPQPKTPSPRYSPQLAPLHSPLSPNPPPCHCVCPSPWATTPSIAPGPLYMPRIGGNEPYITVGVSLAGAFFVSFIAVGLLSIAMKMNLVPKPRVPILSNLLGQSTSLPINTVKNQAPSSGQGKSHSIPIHDPNILGETSKVAVTDQVLNQASNHPSTSSAPENIRADQPTGDNQGMNDSGEKPPGEPSTDEGIQEEEEKQGNRKPADDQKSKAVGEEEEEKNDPKKKKWRRLCKQKRTRGKKGKARNSAIIQNLMCTGCRQVVNNRAGCCFDEEQSETEHESEESRGQPSEQRETKKKDSSQHGNEEKASADEEKTKENSQGSGGAKKRGGSSSGRNKGKGIEPLTALQAAAAASSNVGATEDDEQGDEPGKEDDGKGFNGGSENPDTEQPNEGEQQQHHHDPRSNQSQINITDGTQDGAKNESKTKPPNIGKVSGTRPRHQQQKTQHSGVGQLLKACTGEIFHGAIKFRKDNDEEEQEQEADSQRHGGKFNSDRSTSNNAPEQSEYENREGADQREPDEGDKNLQGQRSMSTRNPSSCPRMEKRKPSSLKKQKPSFHQASYSAGNVDQDRAGNDQEVDNGKADVDDPEVEDEEDDGESNSVGPYNENEDDRLPSNADDETSDERPRNPLVNKKESGKGFTGGSDNPDADQPIDGEQEQGRHQGEPLSNQSETNTTEGSQEGAKQEFKENPPNKGKAASSHPRQQRKTQQSRVGQLLKVCTGEIFHGAVKSQKDDDEKGEEGQALESRKDEQDGGNLNFDRSISNNAPEQNESGNREASDQYVKKESDDSREPDKKLMRTGNPSTLHSMEKEKSSSGQDSNDVGNVDQDGAGNDREDDNGTAEAEESDAQKDGYNIEEQTPEPKQEHNGEGLVSVGSNDGNEIADKPNADDQELNEHHAEALSDQKDETKNRDSAETGEKEPNTVKEKSKRSKNTMSLPEKEKSRSSRRVKNRKDRSSPTAGTRRSEEKSAAVAEGMDVLPKDDDNNEDQQVSEYETEDDDEGMISGGANDEDNKQELEGCHDEPASDQSETNDTDYGQQLKEGYNAAEDKSKVSKNQLSRPGKQKPPSSGRKMGTEKSFSSIGAKREKEKRSEILKVVESSTKAGDDEEQVLISEAGEDVIDGAEEHEPEPLTKYEEFEAGDSKNDMRWREAQASRSREEPLNLEQFVSTASGNERSRATISLDGEGGKVAELGQFANAPGSKQAPSKTTAQNRTQVAEEVKVSNLAKTVNVTGSSGKALLSSGNEDDQVQESESFTSNAASYFQPLSGAPYDQSLNQFQILTTTIGDDQNVESKSHGDGNHKGKKQEVSQLGKSSSIIRGHTMSARARTGPLNRDQNVTARISDDLDKELKSLEGNLEGKSDKDGSNKDVWRSGQTSRGAQQLTTVTDTNEGEGDPNPYPTWNAGISSANLAGAGPFQGDEADDVQVDESDPQNKYSEYELGGFRKDLLERQVTTRATNKEEPPNVEQIISPLSGNASSRGMVSSEDVEGRVLNLLDSASGSKPTLSKATAFEGHGYRDDKTKVQKLKSSPPNKDLRGLHRSTDVENAKEYFNLENIMTLATESDPGKAEVSVVDEEGNNVQESEPSASNANSYLSQLPATTQGVEWSPNISQNFTATIIDDRVEGLMKSRDGGGGYKGKQRKAPELNKDSHNIKGGGRRTEPPTLDRIVPLSGQASREIQQLPGVIQNLTPTNEGDPNPEPEYSTEDLQEQEPSPTDETEHSTE